MYFFVLSFTLSPDDPNYEAYADQTNSAIDEPIYYYVRQVDNMKNDEASTMYVDFQHLSSYNWDDPLFLDKLIQEYSRFEPYLR